MLRPLSDYHVHLERGAYDLEWLQRFIRVGQARGIEQLGLAEHGHRFRSFAAIMAHLGQGYPLAAASMKRRFQLEVGEYVTFVEHAREEGLPVVLGTEVDYVPGFEGAIREWLEPWPWDYVIGSVHYVGKWGIDYSPDEGWPGRDVDETYEQFFALVARAARSGLFDIIGHFDLIKIFGHRPKDRSRVASAAMTALEAIRDAGCCMELNSAGWRRPVAELYPELPYIEAAWELGIPITLSSDAHCPAETGFRLREAAEMARAVGYTSITRFERRRAQQHVL